MEKLELIQLIMDTKNEALLHQIRSLFNSYQVNDDFWDELPNEVQEAIETSLKQSELNQSIPHEEAVKRLNKWD
ncbi:MAG: hypothetical protein EP332_03035 [Bacteroidetes bacterium]|nr:MAG: hypothetical protein EP332_03035 [Bacteroidota bacterium]